MDVVGTRSAEPTAESSAEKRGSVDVQVAPGGAVCLAPGIVIDRFYRGSVVLVGTRTIAIPEELAVELDRVVEARAGQASPASNPAAVALLVERGVLVRSAAAEPMP